MSSGTSSAVFGSLRFAAGPHRSGLVSDYERFPKLSADGSEEAQGFGPHEQLFGPRIPPELAFDVGKRYHV
jgi:hypothetical protein